MAAKGSGKTPGGGTVRSTIPVNVKASVYELMRYFLQNYGTLIGEGTTSAKGVNFSHYASKAIQEQIRRDMEWVAMHVDIAPVGAKDGELSEQEHIANLFRRFSGPPETGKKGS